jgi:hypothetical protein
VLAEIIMKSQHNTETEDSDTVQAIKPQCHELGANILFSSYDLDPYYALDNVIKKHNGSTTDTIRYDESQYEVTISYNTKSGLKPWDNPEFRLETVREFVIKIRAVDDDNRKKVTYQISPRWPDMESLGDSPSPSNPDLVGINAKTQGSNFQTDSYISILRTVFERFGINRRYLSNPHEYSNIFRSEQYVRLDRDKSNRLTRTEGFIDNLSTYCRTHGDSGEMTWDNGQIQGYYSKVKFDSKTAESLISGHSVGKQFKQYHPKYVRNNLSDPLAHPKVGVALIDDTVPWKDRYDLISELNEFLINSLSWSGIETRAGDTYVADDHFDNTDTTLDIQRYDDPIPQIRDNQQQRINELTVNPDLTNSDREILQVLSEGTDTIDTISENIEYTQRTVYRAINRLDDIIRSENGTVKFESENLQTAISGLMSEAKSRIEDTSNATSPFKKWADRFGVSVSEESGRMMLRFGEVPQDYHNKMKEILDHALTAWIKSGNRKKKLEFAHAYWSVNGNNHVQQRLR